MTKKNIFVYKLFLSLNILDLNLFFMWKLQPSSPSLEKVTCLFPSNPPLKVQILSSPSFFENLVGCLMPPPPPPSRKEGGVHTMLCRECQWSCCSKFWSIFLVAKWVSFYLLPCDYKISNKKKFMFFFLKNLNPTQQ